MTARKSRTPAKGAGAPNPPPAPAGQQQIASSTATPPRTPSAAPLIPPRFRDRVKELRRVKASELLKNEKNWRQHPDEQRGALTSMMEKIGVVDAVAVRETPQGLVILDGHLRQDIAGDELIPCLVLDLNEQEADLMLASFDPLGELAIMDADALRSLLEHQDEEIDDNAFFRQLLAEVDNEISRGTARSKEVTEKVVEGMELAPHEHYDFIVVCAQTTHEWNVLIDKLGLTPVKRRAKMGIGRAIRATVLLAKLNAAAAAPPAVA